MSQFAEGSLSGAKVKEDVTITNNFVYAYKPDSAEIIAHPQTGARYIIVVYAEGAGISADEQRKTQCVDDVDFCKSMGFVHCDKEICYEYK